MAEVAEYAIVYHYGDTFDDPTSVQWKDSAGVAKDLTGYTADMKVKTAAGVEVLHLNTGTGGGLTIPTPANGTVVVNATPAVMTAGDLVEGTTYLYDFQVKSADGTIVKTLIKGDFRVDAQITDV